MYNTALRILADREEAGDILQDAFVDVFDKLDTFQGRSSIGAWIKRIVINKAINRYNKKRLLFTHIEDSAYVDEEEKDESYEQDFQYNVHQIQHAIGKLPEGYRVILTLYLIEEYSHKEIADQLGITESTSKSQYNRAKKKVRKIIGEKIRLS
jgi:RNA polymerase sigma-70 factor (ECF subfamily)